MNQTYYKEEDCYAQSGQHPDTHFIHDVRYATVSLKKDKTVIQKEYSEAVFSLPIEEMKERFKIEYADVISELEKVIHNNQGIESTTSLFNLIHQLQQELSELLERVSCLKGAFSAYENTIKGTHFLCIADIRSLKAQCNRNQDIMILDCWCDKKIQGSIRTYLLEAEKKAEQMKTALRKIGASWNMDILKKENRELAEKMGKAYSNSYKLLSASFWIARNQIRTFFKKEIKELNQEIVTDLIQQQKNIASCETWFAGTRREGMSYLGGAYQEEKTEFKKIRIYFELVIKAINQADTLLSQSLLERIGHYMGDKEIELIPFSFIMSELEKKLIALADFRKDYERMAACYRNKEEELSISQMRKTIYLMERIATKQKWLDKNKDKIQEVFGTSLVSAATDFNSYLVEVKAQEKKKEIPYYHEFSCDSWDKTMTELFDAILNVEQPMHEKLLLKRVCESMNYPKITLALKKELAGYLEQHSNQWEKTGDFIADRTKKEVVFRRALDKKRDIAWISDRELLQGIFLMLQIREELTLDEIEKELCDYLKYPRKNVKLKEKVSELVLMLKREGVIHRFSGGFRIL